MVLVPTEKREDTLKMYEELQSKIKAVTNNSNNYDEKYMKIKFNSVDDLPLKTVRNL